MMRWHLESSSGQQFGQALLGNGHNQLIKLAEATLGTKAIHSSQIHGFTTGKLRDPSPKLMMALGELNLAIAKANGEAIKSRYTCPGTLWPSIGNTRRG